MENKNFLIERFEEEKRRKILKERRGCLEKKPEFICC